eukprot:scaffold1239_cov175-Pinguiococcus_pyrenoidosus.AAC.21
MQTAWSSREVSDPDAAAPPPDQVSPSYTSPPPPSLSFSLSREVVSFCGIEDRVRGRTGRIKAALISSLRLQTCTWIVAIQKPKSTG